MIIPKKLDTQKVVFLVKAISLALLALGLLYSCQTAFNGPEDWVLRIDIEAGDEWTHPYPVLGFITRPNYPTFALWLSDEENNFLETVFVTAKIGKAKWIMADDSRPEALPLWSKTRGGQPESANPETDAVCGATPKGSHSYGLPQANLPERMYVWLEINHSVDYNDYYAADIQDPGDPYYSGGKGGSGQPALVYRAYVDRSAPAGTKIYFELMGHSQPGGSWQGTDYYEGGTDSLSTALQIIQSAVLTLR
ncbi:MAG: hypothetical protein KKI09_11405 [Spirochaetes bacterium]|nr:hypothetical protein [Spirochaetota bacterium]